MNISGTVKLPLKTMFFLAMWSWHGIALKNQLLSSPVEDIHGRSRWVISDADRYPKVLLEMYTHKWQSPFWKAHQVSYYLFLNYGGCGIQRISAQYLLSVREIFSKTLWCYLHTVTLCILQLPPLYQQFYFLFLLWQNSTYDRTLNPYAQDCSHLLEEFLDTGS